MNPMQRLSQRIESDRLKLQMGLSPDIEIDTLTLRAMWRQLCRELGLDECDSGARNARRPARLT